MPPRPVGEAAEELETSAGAGDGTPSTVPEVVDGGNAELRSVKIYKKQ